LTDTTSTPFPPVFLITSSPDTIWLIVDRKATLFRIDPRTGEVRQRIRVPRGSYNPLYGAGQIWISRAGGAEVTVITMRFGSPTMTPGRFLIR